jgi:hypothetical protein
MEEAPGSSGRLTRSQAKKRPASTPLRSPMISDLFPAAASRKQARTGNRPAPTLRSLRKKGGTGESVQLSGYLGLLPEEVGCLPICLACRLTAAALLPLDLSRWLLRCDCAPTGTPRLCLLLSPAEPT